MPKTYQALGFSLLYPDTWRVEDEAESASILLESPEGAFLSISKLASTAEIRSALDQAEQAMRSEYEDVEQEDYAQEVESFKMSGVTQRFVCLDMIVTSHLLSFACQDKAYLVQMQAEDRDMERLEIVFNAILTSFCKSLKNGL